MTADNSTNITQVEREQAKRRLREAEELSAILLKYVSDAIIVVDQEGLVVEASQEAVNLCGISPVNRPFRQVFPMKTYTGDISILDHTLKGEYFENIPAFFERGDGLAANLLMNSSPLTNVEGQVTGVVFLLRNITRQKQAESKLQESEAQYRQLYARMLDGYALFDVLRDGSLNPYDYRFVEINDTFLRISGLAGKYVLRQTLREMGATWASLLYETAVSHMPRTVKAYPLPSGCIVNAIVFSPRLGQVVVILEDITEKVHYETELKASQGRLATIADGIPAILAYVDTDERYLYVNQAFGEWFGCSKEDVIGKTVREVCGEKSYTLTLPNIRQALRGERSILDMRSNWRGERLLRLHFLPHLNELGAVVAYYTLIQEIQNHSSSLPV